MHHQTEAQQEAASLAWAQHFAPRTEGPSEFALAVRAGQVRHEAQKVRQRIEAMGMEAGLPLTPDELSKDLRAGYERQGELLRSIQYKPE